jgi:hypothetical protein
VPWRLGGTCSWAGKLLRIMPPLDSRSLEKKKPGSTESLESVTLNSYPVVATRCYAEVPKRCSCCSAPTPTTKCTDMPTRTRLLSPRFPQLCLRSPRDPTCLCFRPRVSECAIQALSTPDLSEARAAPQPRLACLLPASHRPSPCHH